MKTMKRIFALMLAILMCFMCLPFSAYAEEPDYDLWDWRLGYIDQWSLQPTVKTYEFDYETDDEEYDVGKIIFYATEFTLDIYAHKYNHELTGEILNEVLPEMSNIIIRINVYGNINKFVNVFNDLPYLETVYIGEYNPKFENSFNNCPNLARIEFRDNRDYSESTCKNSFNNLCKNGVAWVGLPKLLKKKEPDVVNSFANTTLYASVKPKESIQNFKVANGKNGVTLTWDNPNGYYCQIFRGDKDDYDNASDWWDDEYHTKSCSYCKGETNYYDYGYNDLEPDGVALCRFEKYSTKLADLYVNTYVDRNVESGTTYYYSNNLGDNVIPITYLAPPTVTVKVTGSTTANISWKEVKGAEGYYVYQSTTGKKGSWTRIGNLSADKRSINAKKLFPETNYYFCVKAYKGKDISYGTTKTVKTNALAKTFTGFVSCGNDKYYAKNGKIQKSLTSMVKVDGKYYYVKKGALAKNSTGFVVYKDSKFYVKNGVSPTGKTLVKNKGKWYYVKNGKFAATSTGFVKYGKYYYYVKNGVAQTTSTTLVKVNGKWYYIKKGVYAAKSTGFVKYGNYKYYVKNGVAQITYKGLVKYKGNHYYVNKGVRQYTTGKVVLNGKTYTLSNGIVK